MTETYLGNKNLKRKDVKIQYTPEQIQEYAKCARDHKYFVTHYVKIVNVDQGLMPFELWDFQERMIDTFVDNRFSICKLPRQVGKTTTVAATILWYILFTDNFNVAILAHKAEQAREVLARIKLAYEHLPKWLQQGILNWNKGDIELENGSRVRAAATSSGSIRGGSFNLIYLDEFAHVPTNLADDFFRSVYPTISSGQTTKVIITSTPKGLNMFHKLWDEAISSKNDYVPIEIHWSDVPGRDDQWRLETIRNTSEDQFRQEFECEFLGSSSTLINGAVLARLTSQAPIHQNAGVKIFKHPIANHTYVACVDVARGTGLDYSAIVIIDITQVPYEVVATYRDNKITSMMFPSVLHSLVTSYNKAYVLVEINDVGQTIAERLYYDFEYENVMTTASHGRLGQVISSGFKAQSKLGVRTTKSVKKIGCANLKSMVEGNKLILNDEQLVYELRRFANLRGDTFEAEEGNDDLVMCCVLFSWLVSQDYIKNLTDTNVSQQLHIENIEAIEEDVSPFGFVDYGETDESEGFTGVVKTEFDLEHMLPPVDWLEN